jgi:hypothetical protein
MDEPCTGWVPNHALCGAWSGFSSDVQAYADRIATRVIWAASGRQYGLCTTTVRPCWMNQLPLYQTFPVGTYGEGYWSLVGTPGGGVQVFPGAQCSCAAACACLPPQVALPGPVASVTEVVIDGVTLDPAAYRVDNSTYLVRQDGQSWPQAQNLSAVDGSAGTWHVTYQLGQAVPPSLQDAAGLYACEVGRALTGGTCQLPNRVRQITRAGTTIDFVNTDDYLKDGRTGYDQVDMILHSYNPWGLVQRPRVLSPDLPQYR